MVGPLVCPPPPPPSFFLLYDSVPIYYETEGFSRESRTIESALAVHSLAGPSPTRPHFVFIKMVGSEGLS